ncbi:long-chain acyl-CoA synthetase [Sphingomonas zeicaulis]|uniref:AMP-binding protein n=1 Tax=Sphingomonas zeicaulis TaxID=1632740 RepID=UPI003D1EBE43
MKETVARVAPEPVPTGGCPADPAGALPLWTALAARGQLFSHWAERFGDAPALHSARGDRSFADLDRRANRLVRCLRAAGLSTGSPVAALCGNIPAFVEILLACQRGGYRFTPVNWHLSAEEVAYIVEDCGARALIVQADFADRVPASAADGLLFALAVEGTAPGFVDYEVAIAAFSGDALDDPVLGRTMLYTSGTTGRPKGVVKPGAATVLPMREGSSFGYRDGDVNLLCGPAYHGGPLAFDLLFPLASGAAIVMMERFDPAEALALIARHRVTHTHMVATMFQRLLALPDAMRSADDLSSLRMVVHGAAPTPPEVKRAMIDWLGPVLWEYYAATEVATRIHITSEEWLRKPGSVGRIPPDSGACVLDETGAPCPPGVTGRVSFPNIAALAPRYHNAPDKNRDTFGGSHFSVGDIGHIDADGYLFLTGRSAETIISGGVNIYPQEIDMVMLDHPAVRQCCTVGTPNPEWGEEVRAVVALAPNWRPSAELAADLIAFAAGRLARYKLPRAVDFVNELPHSPAGKVLRADVRRRYWDSLARHI